uniref:Uncharacterized protein n=1 Tax=Trypanosoma vivax (strain Y486) TaxID=1055687 RepID=G0U339_TRYVY|nr:hypothetical protein, unlikely [Trypanosoma vivax Y486]
MSGTQKASCFRKQKCPKNMPAPKLNTTKAAKANSKSKGLRTRSITRCATFSTARGHSPQQTAAVCARPKTTTESHLWGHPENTQQMHLLYRNSERDQTTGKTHGRELFQGAVPGLICSTKENKRVT